MKVKTKQEKFSAIILEVIVMRSGKLVRLIFAQAPYFDIEFQDAPPTWIKKGMRVEVDTKLGTITRLSNPDALGIDDKLKRIALATEMLNYHFGGHYIQIEGHVDRPGVFHVWFVKRGTARRIIGAGYSRLEALENTLNGCGLARIYRRSIYCRLLRERVEAWFFGLFERA